MLDYYKTIKEPGFGEFKDRGSKFLAFAAPVFSDTDCHDFLESVKKLHPKARHHCYAFRLGLDGNLFRANDDGEPSGTAGRPILGQIDSFGLTNVMIVVVRYFGGTLLGTSGLINAYKGAAEICLSNCETVEKIVEAIYRIHFDYAKMSDLMNALKKLNLEITSQNFELNPSLDVAIRLGEVAHSLNELKALVEKIPLEMAEKIEEIDGLKFEFLRKNA